MLRSGAMARWWVGALHRLGSALTLKTQSVGNKRPGGPTRGHPPQRVVSSCRAECRGPGPPVDTSPKTTWRKTQHGSFGSKSEPGVPQWPLLGTARPGARSRPSARKKSLETRTRLREESAYGASSAWATDSASPGGGPGR